MSSPLPKAIQVPSRLARITRLAKRMLAVVAALESAEAMTLRDKRRILSRQLSTVRHKGGEPTVQVVDYPLQPKQPQPDLRVKWLAG